MTSAKKRMDTLHSIYWVSSKTISRVLYNRKDVKEKIREWFFRYVPLEVAATVAALLSASAALYVTGNPIVAAYAGTWGEFIAYYAAVSIREVAILSRRNGASGVHESITRSFRNVVFEFGPAEGLDSFIVRPFFMYLMPRVLGDFSIGIVAGKILADIVFYTITIFSFEVRKRIFK